MAGNRVLVLGGVRSGKSSYAQHLLAGETEVTYLATGYPPGADRDWAARVAAHVETRPAHWTTIETTDLSAQLNRTGGPVLVDCLTLWLTRVMDADRGWDAERVPESVNAAMHELIEAWRATTRRAVVVSNEVGMGVVPATRSGIRFRDLLGALNRELAGAADAVWLVVAGIPLRVK